MNLYSQNRLTKRMLNLVNSRKFSKAFADCSLVCRDKDLVAILIWTGKIYSKQLTLHCKKSKVQCLMGRRVSYLSSTIRIAGGGPDIQANWCDWLDYRTVQCMCCNTLPVNAVMWGAGDLIIQAAFLCLRCCQLFRIRSVKIASNSLDMEFVTDSWIHTKYDTKFKKF